MQLQEKNFVCLAALWNWAHGIIHTYVDWIIIIIIIQKICSTHNSHPAGCSRCKSRNTRASPLLFHDKCPGLFYVHTGPTALRPIRRTKQLWSSVLLKDTSAATGQFRIRTHILTTPQLESNALDRSATTLLVRTHAQPHNFTNSKSTPFWKPHVFRQLSITFWRLQNLSIPLVVIISSPSLTFVLIPRPASFPVRFSLI